MPWCLVYSTSGWVGKKERNSPRRVPRLSSKGLRRNPCCCCWWWWCVCVCLLRYFDMRLISSLLWKLLLLCLRLLLAPLLEEKMVSLSLFSLSSLSLLSLLSLFSLFISLLSSLSVEVSRDELLYLQVVNACYLRRKIEKKLKEKGRREDHSSRTSLRRRIIIIVIDSTQDA